jgi:hypothetical protein
MGGREALLAGRHNPGQQLLQGMRDQIEMAQYIRGRIGEDRDTVLDMNHRPGLLTKEWPPGGIMSLG